MFSHLHDLLQTTDLLPDGELVGDESTFVGDEMVWWRDDQLPQHSPCIYYACCQTVTRLVFLSIGFGKSCEVKDCFVSFSVEENCEQFLAGQVTILAGHHPLRPASRLF